MLSIYKRVDNDNYSEYSAVFQRLHYKINLSQPPNTHLLPSHGE